MGFVPPPPPHPDPEQDKINLQKWAANNAFPRKLFAYGLLGAILFGVVLFLFK